jgi:hypothetical protein
MKLNIGKNVFGQIYILNPDIMDKYHSKIEPKLIWQSWLKFLNLQERKRYKNALAAWSNGNVTARGVKGREIESRRGIGWLLKKL